jgi:two-component system, OmpR family, sensor kinase
MRSLQKELGRLRRTVDRQQQFIEDVTHELLTPLAIIRSQLELHGEHPAAGLVCDEVERMTRLVDELRVVAHAPRPGFLELELLDAGDVVEDVFEKVRGLAPRDWRLERRSGGWLVGDRRRLEQALINLARNAVEHTGADDRIVIGAAVDGRRARLWVADSGPGVPADEQARIFERFGNGRRHHPDSTGLGLAIVSAIARGHGGRAELASAPGDGATFAIVVPLIAQETAEAPALAAVGS